METYRMVGAAKSSPSRKYVSEYGEYTGDKGFIMNEEYYSNDKDKIEWVITRLFDEDCWTLAPKDEQPKVMTKQEIENALGYKVEIADDEENRASVEQKKARKAYEKSSKQKDFIEILELLGIV